VIYFVQRRWEKAMVPYQKERIINAICFFASEHNRRTGLPVFQTYIYKYLALLEFWNIERTGVPVLGLSYDALERGPVPKEIYYEKKYQKTDKYEFEKCDLRNVDNPNITKVIVKEQPDLDYFSEQEIELMNEILDKFAKRCTRTKNLIDESHKIRAYKVAWRARGEKKKSQIRYDDMFANLVEKPRDELTFAEENFLAFSAFQDC
jgi:hypothetical protein